MPNDEPRKSRGEKLQDFRRQRFEVVVRSAESALKSAFLVNGGGAVALLTFFGQAMHGGKPNLATSYLAVALLMLVIGTAIAGLATGLSFLAQYGYFMRKSRSWFGKAAPVLTKINIVLVLLSYVCFVVAGAVAYVALS